MEKARQSISEVSRLVVVALIASLLVLVAPFQAPSKADYTSFNSGPIVYNDRVCNLGDPNDHSTSATAFEISTSDQLWEVTDCVSNSATIYFELGDDIDVSQATTAPTNSPIGYSTSGDISFSGVLDGNNKLISGLDMSTTSYGVGLFAWLAGATVSNVAIAGSFSTSSTANTQVLDSAGALAIRGTGVISLVSLSNTANVTGEENVGGLVGYINGDTHIQSSRNAGTITGYDDVGGFVGDVAGSDLFVSDSHNEGNVTGDDAVSGDAVGGLVGIVRAGDARIMHSSNEGSIRGSSEVGGFIGEVDDNVMISFSFNIGVVSGTGEEVGGFVGFVDDESAYIDNSYNIGNVTGTSGDVGGFVGLIEEESAYIDNSYNEGNISGSSNVGGFVGHIQDEYDDDAANAYIDNSYNEGAISGAVDVGGFVGDVDENAYISHSFNKGNVTGGGGDVGGFVGFIEQGDADIVDSYNSGAIAGGHDDVGGFVGEVNDDAWISASHNSGVVSGTSYVGGFVGSVYDDTRVYYSFNTGNVNGQGDNVGGFHGLSDYYADIVSSYNTGNISGSNYVAGFIGDLARESSIVTSYNTGNIFGSGNNVAGIVGRAQSNLDAQQLSNHGTISGSINVGGLFALLNGTTTISLSHNTGPIAATANGGGLIGNANSDLTIEESANLANVSASGSIVGGLLGSSHGNSTSLLRTFNLGQVSGADTVGGLIGSASNLVVTESYNAGTTAGDGLVASMGGTISTYSVYTSVASQFLATTPAAQLKVAATYVGYDFATVWGFGTCSQNQGFPMLRSLGLATNYFIDLCTDPPPPPPPTYQGPVIQSAELAEVAGAASYAGKRLNTVTKVMAGGQELTIRSATSQSLELQLPPELVAGVYDLVMLSSYGTLTFQQGLTVVANQAVVVPENAEPSVDGPILTAGSFKGYVAIYTKGYEGQRLSAKVAGKWLVVPELNESWKNLDYSRTVRFTGPGKSITVDLYIDREFVKSVQLVTK